MGIEWPKDEKFEPMGRRRRKDDESVPLFGSRTRKNVKFSHPFSRNFSFSVQKRLPGWLAAVRHLCSALQAASGETRVETHSGEKEEEGRREGKRRKEGRSCC
jgi:hypothetical protein